MEESMLQQVMAKPGEIVYQEVPIPEIGSDQVLIRIRRIGICGSDIHVYHGTHPFTSYPITQGHEASGEIVKTGSAVKDFCIGQKVTIEPQLFCGECYPCTHGKYNLCEKLKVFGFQTTGVGSEYFAVDASKVDLLPENMSFDEGAMLEPLAVTVHAAKRFSELEGAKVAILGAGPIGILLAQTCKALGAAKILITDISDYRLELAREVGADFAVNTGKKDFGQALKDAFGSDRADVIYECAGTDITMDQAIQNARKGSTIILVAVFGKPAVVDLAVLNDHELDLNTTMMYQHEDFLQAIQLVEEKKVCLEPLMSRHFPFQEFKKAYEYIDENRERSMKVLIDLDTI